MYTLIKHKIQWLEARLDSRADQKKEKPASVLFICEDGKIEDVKVLNGVDQQFDKQTVKNLFRTKGKWSPAMFNKKPIQSQIVYDVNYGRFIGPLRPVTVQQ